MSAQAQTPSQTSSNVYPMSGASGRAAGWETWPHGVYLIVTHDSGRPLLQPVANDSAAIAQHNQRTLAEALKWAAAAGGKLFPVFPCKLQWDANKQKVEKRPLTLNGFKNATTDSAEIIALWTACTAPAVIGLRCSEAFVVDGDLQHETARAWTAENLPKLNTWGYYTPSTGRHWLFQQPKIAPGKNRIKCSQNLLADKVDIRGDDGYVIVWAALGYPTFGENVAPCPDWLAEQLRRENDRRPPRVAEKPAEFVSDAIRALRAEIVRGIRNDARFDDRYGDGWIKMLGAIQHSFSGDLGLGYELWLEFCDRRENQDAINADKDEKAWETYQGPPKATFGSIVRWAEQQGDLAEQIAAYNAAMTAEKAEARAAKLRDMPFPDGGDGGGGGGGSGNDKSGGSANNPENGSPANDENGSQPIVEIVRGLQHKAADAGIEAMYMANVPFYQRGSKLARVHATKAKTSDGEDTLVPGITPVTLPMLGRALNTSAIWTRMTKKGLIRVDCPLGVIKEIDSMSGHWPFSPLAGLIGTPTLRPDDSLLCEPGYDLATGYYLHNPPPMPVISEHPTRQEAEEALRILDDDLLFEFPFVGKADRAVAMSMLMTPVLRAALGSAVPIHVASAPAAGTGKSYLFDTASAICLGERCPVQSVAPREEETEKRLIGAALAGHPIIALDNCNGVLSGDFLAQVSSSAVMLLRALGSSDQFRINNVFTVFANGNNIVIYGDLTRRVVRAMLDANIADPTKRKYAGDPVKKILADRGRYVAAVLTIVRAYIAAGEPNPPHPVPSFERWSNLVCGSLVWLGWSNPADTMDAVREEDPSCSDLASVLAAWPATCKSDNGETAAELIAVGSKQNDRGHLIYPDWQEAIKLVAVNIKSGIPESHKFAKWLASHRDQMVGENKLLRCGTANRPRWTVASLKKEEKKEE
jgi:Bifunctional DNA primase/polymerase, N-terminal